MNTPKIYILDDHEERQRITYKPFIDIDAIDKSLVRFIHKTSEISISEILENGQCVCIHDSMGNGNDKNGDLLDFESLKRKIKENKNLLVVFSNQGNQRTELISDIELTMRSDDFYMNFMVFLHEGSLNLEILALGKNYRFEKLLQLKGDIIQILQPFESFEPIILDIEDKQLLRKKLEKIDALTKKNEITNLFFRKLNAGQLNKVYVESEIGKIIKFLK